MHDTEPRRPGDLVFAVLLLLASLVLFQQAYAIAGFASPSSAGVFPMLAAATMAGASAVILVNLLRGGATQGSVSHEQLRRFGREVAPLAVVVLVAFVVVYMAVMPWVGFLPATGAFLFAAIWFLDKRHPIRALVVSLVALAAVYAVFHLVFGVLLP